MNSIELDELLNGNPTQEQISDYFKNGEFYQEGYLVAAIKKHLRREDHKQTLYKLDYSIEDMLNGRCLISHEKEIDSIYKDWNDKLGFVYFKF